jgi:ferredoxin
MPKIVIHAQGQAFEGEVSSNTNLVVRAGIKQFPFPHLKYRCGMGKCGTCASRILAGAEHLPEPNWKEKKVLGERLALGYRLCCQLWIEHDLELTQEAAAEHVQPRSPARAAPAVKLTSVSDKAPPCT